MTLPRPRRLQPPAPPGALLKCFADPPRRITTDARSPDYLDMVRQLPCLYCGVSPCEAAHVRFASGAFGKASGMGKKPDDRWALSLCADCYRLAKHAQHNHGEERFWEAIGINPLLVCQSLWAQRHDFVAMQAVVMVAIANRSKR